MIRAITTFILLLVAAIQLPSGELTFDPPVIDVVRDSTGFVQALVKFTSTSGDTVKVTNIAGSCRCAIGTVQRPYAHDSTTGAVYLGVNAKHFTDSLNYVDYTIDHTGEGSPAHYRVIVRLKP